MLCGLLGRRLPYSYSPAIHSLFGCYDYTLFEREPEDVEHFLKTGDFAGLNVTIPYKKAVIPYLSELTPEAQALGAVNTVLRREDGSLLGHNTDLFGFRSMVARSGLSPAGKKALVLGSGGASAVAQKVLGELGAEVVVISRTGENHYGNLPLHKDAGILVNATPVGTFPHVEEAPLSLAHFPALEGVLDLTYNPARTKLLMEGEALGLVTENGLWMLVAQAWESACLFSGNSLPEARIPQVYKAMASQMENIILIGMPGCGKSTAAQALGKVLGRPVVDADREVEALGGCSIPKLFAEFGESRFRELETQVLARLGMGSGQIISTGGGCVKREENYPLLHRNGKIIWLQRDISRLSREGRPLSQGGDLEEMYRSRAPLYERFSDFRCDNNGPLEETVRQILEVLE